MIRSIPRRLSIAVGITSLLLTVTGACPASAAGVVVQAPLQIDTRPPTIGGVPKVKVVDNSHYSWSPTAVRAVTFTAVNLPLWAHVNAKTGELYGDTKQADVGVWPGITITATNSFGSASLPPFSITVFEIPTIGGPPPVAAVVGSDYEFKPVSTAATSFSINPALPPDGLVFSKTTGALSGKPSKALVYPNIVITAINADGSAALAPFTLTVADKPVASGSVVGTLTVTPVPAKQCLHPAKAGDGCLTATFYLDKPFCPSGNGATRLALDLSGGGAAEKTLCNRTAYGKPVDGKNLCDGAASGGPCVLSASTDGKCTSIGAATVQVDYLCDGVAVGQSRSTTIILTYK